MEINWSTFLLEIINFLVLVWILKRFLYKPVQNVIARRKACIDETLSKAETVQAEAERLREQHENRLSEWKTEKQKAHEELGREIETEKARRMKELQDFLEQEKEKNRVAEERDFLDAKRKIEETALMYGAIFAARLLKEAAGPETESRLIDMAIGELNRLSAEQISFLRSSYEKSKDDIVVTSAYPLSDKLRHRLKLTLAAVINPELSIRFEQNTELLAGVLITINSWVLGANLRDELKGFAAMTPAQ